MKHSHLQIEALRNVIFERIQNDYKNSFVFGDLAIKTQRHVDLGNHLIIGDGFELHRDTLDKIVGQFNIAINNNTALSMTALMQEQNIILYRIQFNLDSSVCHSVARSDANMSWSALDASIFIKGNNIFEKTISFYKQFHNLVNQCCNGYIYLIRPSVNSKAYDGLSYFYIKNEIADNHLRLISHLLPSAFLPESMELVRHESTKSAIAAIMSRNMSHNLGSHVVTNAKHQILELERNQSDDSVKKQLKGLSALLQYLQERQDFIAVIANDEHYPKGPLNFKSSVFDMLAMDGPPVRHNTENRVNNYILDNIVRSEGIARSGSMAGAEHESVGIEIQLVKVDGTGASKDFKSLGAPEIGSEFSDFTLSVNYGLNGRQAFLTILENIIRNAAKHDKYALLSLENNTLLFSIIFQESTDGYFEITITNNIKNFSKAKRNLENKGVIKNGKLAPLSILREDGGGIDKDNKGIKEILICLAWAKYGEKTASGEINYDTLQNTPWELLEVVGVDTGNFKVYDWDAPSPPSGLSLGYRFRIAKFKSVHLLSSAELTQDSSKDLTERMSKLPGASIYAVQRSDYNAHAANDILQAIPRLVVVDNGETEQTLDGKLDDLYEQCLKQRFGDRLPRLRITDTLKTERRDWDGGKSVVREYDWAFADSWGREYPGDFIHYRHHYETCLANAASINDLGFESNAVFTEGISGGNYTNTLVRTDISRFGYYAIIEAALVEIAIVDERLFAKYAGRPGRATAEDKPVWTYLRQKGIHILNSDEQGVYDLWGRDINAANVVPPGGYDYIAVHLGLLDKTTGANSSEKIAKLFGASAVSENTKIAIHSGRGGLAQVEDIAFVPLSGIEWALENCKFVLSDFFHGLKYPPVKSLTRSKPLLPRPPRIVPSGSGGTGVSPVGLQTRASARAQHMGGTPMPHDPTGWKPVLPNPLNPRNPSAGVARKVFLFTTYRLSESSLVGKALDGIGISGIDRLATRKVAAAELPGFDLDKIAHIDSTFFFYPCATKLAVPSGKHSEFVNHLVGCVLGAMAPKNGETIELHLVLHASDVQPARNPGTTDVAHEVIDAVRQKFPAVSDARIWWFSHTGTGIDRRILCNGKFFDGTTDKPTRLLTELASCTNTTLPSLPSGWNGSRGTGSLPVSMSGSSGTGFQPVGSHSQSAAFPQSQHMGRMPMPHNPANSAKWTEMAIRVSLQKEHLNRLAVWQLNGAVDQAHAASIFTTAIGSNESNWGHVPSPEDCNERLSRPRPVLVVGAKPLNELIRDDDRRANYLDSSIWCRHAKTPEEAEAIRRQFEKYDRLGLYQSNAGKEYLEYWARICVNARLARFSDSGHSRIVPVVYHSEGEMQTKAIGHLARIKRDFARHPLTWKILLIDDHAEQPLTGDAGSPCKISSKLEVICEALAPMFSIVVYKKDGSETRFGEPGGSLNINFHYAETLDEAKELFKRCRFDLILLDYLLTSPGSATAAPAFNTSDQLLNDLTATSDEERGPLGKFWITNVSAFTNALDRKLMAQGFSYNSEFWRIDKGACAVNTPELFKHNLLAFMLEQLNTLTALPSQKNRPRGSTRIVTLVDLLRAIFVQNRNQVRNLAERHFPDLLNHNSDYKLLHKDIAFSLVSKADKTNPGKMHSNPNKSEIVYSLFPDIAHYNKAFWDHLLQLVHLTAYGTPQQWPEMLVNFKEIKQILLDANKDRDGQSVRELVNAIENYIIRLNSPDAV